MFSPTLSFPKITMSSITVRPLDPEFPKNLTKWMKEHYIAT